jgi:non-ribosomal peptide synthetase component F
LHRGGCTEVFLPEPLTGALKALGRHEHATLFMPLLTAFQVLLSRYAGSEDIVVGSMAAGRNWVETEKLIGLFLKTLVLRTNLSGNPTFRELLGRVREACLGAYSHQDLPFEQLLEALRPDRVLSTPPPFPGGI